MKNLDLHFTDVLTPLLIYNTKTRGIREVNEASLDLYGYTRDEMLSMRIDDLHPSSNIPSLEQYLSESEDLRTRNSGVWIHKTKEGRDLYLQVYSHLVNYKEEECRLVTLHDVTRRYQLKERLETEQKLFDLLVDKLPGIVFLVNQENKLVRWNRRLEDLSGYRPKEIEKMEPVDFIADFDKSTLADAISTAYNDGYVEVEAALQSKHGENVPVYFKGTHLNMGEQDCVLGLGVDISRQKEDQEQINALKRFYQSIMDQTDSLIWVKDIDQKILYVNKAFLDFFDLTREKVVGKPKSEVLPEQDLQSMQETDKQVFNDGESIQVEETITKNGREHILLSSKFLLPEAKGYGRCICGISTDITRRKKAEEDLKKALKDRETLLAEIHHRVKNNLAVISSMMQLQSMGSEQPEVRSQLQDSQMRIQSIALVHELLYESENFHDLNLGEHLRQLIEYITDMLHAHADITTELQLEPVKLSVTQALACANIANELITNAYKHAFVDQEQGMIVVKLYEDDGVVYLEVSDDGKGLPLCL